MNGNITQSVTLGASVSQPIAAASSAAPEIKPRTMRRRPARSSMMGNYALGALQSHTLIKIQLLARRSHQRCVRVRGDELLDASELRVGLGAVERDERDADPRALMHVLQSDLGCGDLRAGGGGVVVFSLRHLLTCSCL